MADSNENSRIWRDLFPTDPKYVRPADRAGVPKGLLSSIDTTWRAMRLTEYFGPFGKGWGIEEEPKPLVIDAGEQTLIMLTLKCFWVDPEPPHEKHIIYGFGGDSITKKKVGAPPSSDDEALKKCATDALFHAYYRLGLSADIWLNMHKDSKYLATVREHYENSRAIQEQLLQSHQQQIEEDTKRR